MSSRSPRRPTRGSSEGAIRNDLNALFVLLGGVSLLVGAIGIANVTLVSVLERVGEIGLRRALGAARRHIAAQFLLESTAMGALGGVAGASIGTLVVVGISATRTWTPVLDPRYPARRAAARRRDRPRLRHLPRPPRGPHGTGRRAALRHLNEPGTTMKHTSALITMAARSALLAGCGGGKQATAPTSTPASGSGGVEEQLGFSQSGITGRAGEGRDRHRRLHEGARGSSTCRSTRSPGRRRSPASPTSATRTSRSQFGYGIATLYGNGHRSRPTRTTGSATASAPPIVAPTTETLSGGRPEQTLLPRRRHRRLQPARRLHEEGQRRHSSAAPSC